VKPGNLFVAETRDGKRVKVLDFGLAKILAPDTFMKPEAQPTAAHVFVCSPSYGAPEQFSRDIGALSPATDVYSFAFVLMEMMTGKKVREVGNIMEGMLRAIDPRFASPSPSSLGLELSPAIEKVFVKAVSLDPLERYKDAGEFWDALEEAAVAVEEPPPKTDPLPSDPKQKAREELARIAERFKGVNLGKGGTLAMPEGSRPLESTISMANAPKRPDKVETEPLAKPMAERTLPLGTRLPSAPGPVTPQVLDGRDTLPPRPRQRQPSFPAMQEQTRAPEKSNVVPWIIAIVVFLLAAVGTLAIVSRHKP